AIDVLGSIHLIANTLFSSLILAGVIDVINLQSKEQLSQRTELALTRKELTKFTEAQHEQAKVLLGSPARTVWSLRQINR
ncbi:hypothetical protein, partial [Pseudomonas sp.]|uniref:hypothetical protein n=1 Tax=Pseudomonas sp. TaxID=306 RepID=UPI003FD7B1C7